MSDIYCFIEMLCVFSPNPEVNLIFSISYNTHSMWFQNCDKTSHQWIHVKNIYYKSIGTSKSRISYFGIHSIMSWTYSSQTLNIGINVYNSKQYLQVSFQCEKQGVAWGAGRHIQYFEFGNFHVDTTPLHFQQNVWSLISRASVWVISVDSAKNVINVILHTSNERHT